MEEEGIAYTFSDIYTHTQELEKGRCSWKRRIGI